MNTAKRILSVILALVLAVGLSVPAFATGTGGVIDPGDGISGEFENSGGGGGGGGGGMYYTLNYESNGGTKYDSQRYVSGQVVKLDKEPEREGYRFTGWYEDEELTKLITEIKMTDNKTVYAGWEKVYTPDDTGVSDWLNTKDHNAFLNGYDNGFFGAGNNMTRSQVAQMFYNLLLDKDVEITVSFSDVPADTWYAKAVNALASIGIIQGVGNGQFAPNRAITRAEFTVIAMRFADLDTSGKNIFDDVSADDWFYKQVVGSIQYGWITGYEDGTFRPYNTIARAEVTAIVNRMLGRTADKDYVDEHIDELRQFPDVSKNSWAYYNIMEATNAHDYSQSGGAETWKSLNK